MYHFVAEAFREKHTLRQTCFTNLCTSNQLQKQNHPETFHGGLISESKIKTFKMTVWNAIEISLLINSASYSFLGAYTTPEFWEFCQFKMLYKNCTIWRL